MTAFSPHAPETRDAVLALLRSDPTLSLRVVAQRSGVSESTVGDWRRVARIRPQRKGRAPFDPSALPPNRREAAARLLALPGVDPRDVAVVLGGPKRAAAALRKACGLGRRNGAWRREAARADAGPPDLAALDASLRAHLGRQIAAFDARLCQGGETQDSAKTLRDLGGLKRLYDDLAARASTTGQGKFDGGADGDSAEDLAALRERVARRCAAILRERHAADAAGEADAGGAAADRL